MNLVPFTDNSLPCYRIVVSWSVSVASEYLILGRMLVISLWGSIYLTVGVVLAQVIRLSAYFYRYISMQWVAELVVVVTSAVQLWWNRRGKTPSSASLFLFPGRKTSAWPKIVESYPPWVHTLRSLVPAGSCFPDLLILRTAFARK